MANRTEGTATHPRVVIIGAGFGGLKAASHLGSPECSVTVIDKSNHHLFQPLLYQVATAGLSPGDIASPIRQILRKKSTTEVLMSTVTGIDKSTKLVKLENGSTVPYDYLIVATGARHSYFGHDEWEKYAPGLKSIPDATRIRAQILGAYEAAELEADPQKQKALLTIVIVGAGPTGCELAGSIAELAHKGLERNFRNFDPNDTRVLLIEAGPGILSAFPKSLAAAAERELKRLGVEVLTNTRVENISESGVAYGGTVVAANTVIWAAGVKASPAHEWLEVEGDKAGRVPVNRFLTIDGHPEIFVIGDTAIALDADNKPLPGVAAVAMQQGEYVAKAVKAAIAGKKSDPFHYLDKGSLATIGRAYAIAKIAKFKLAGFGAWLTWLFVHILYLIGFRNRIIVLTQWAWAYLTYQRGVRLIADSIPAAAVPIESKARDLSG